MDFLELDEKIGPPDEFLYDIHSLAEALGIDLSQRPEAGRDIPPVEKTLRRWYQEQIVIIPLDRSCSTVEEAIASCFPGMASIAELRM